MKNKISLNSLELLKSNQHCVKIFACLCAFNEGLHLEAKKSFIKCPKTFSSCLLCGGSIYKSLCCLKVTRPTKAQ